MGHGRVSRLRTVALLARRPGLLVLADALLADPRIEIVQVFTHSRLPKAEGGGVRREVSDFARVCREGGVSFRALDWNEAARVEDRLPEGELDLLLALSWRAKVSAAALSRFRRGAINLHRGALPRYAGAEPVRQAMEAGEKRLAITAHRMAAEIDAGEVLEAVWLDLPPNLLGRSDAPAIEEGKRRLEPLYAPLARAAIAALLRQCAA